jgi:hypothetical protein
MRWTISGTILIAALMMGGCEEREPVTRAQVVSHAYNLQVRDGVNWGEPVETLPPATVDADGRRWWQLRYHPGKDGRSRVVLVDADSGWARYAPQDYVPRQAPPPKASGEQPLAVPEGSLVLVVTPAATVDDAGRRALEQEVRRLNALATNTGLPALFSLRERRDQQVSVIYGWQGDHGIAREERVVDWITARTPYRDLQWEDQAPRP